MLKNLSKNSKAQSLIEYSIVIGIISVILVAMTPFLKRPYQGMIKTVADQIGIQKAADQGFNQQERGGYLKESYIQTSAVSDKTTNHIIGNTIYIYGGSTRTESSTVSDLGFTNTQTDN